MVDDEARDLLQAAVAEPTRPAPVAEIRRRGDRRRMRRRVGALLGSTVLLVVIAGALVSALPSVDVRLQPGPAAEPSAPSAWTRYHSLEHDFTVAHPPGWNRAHEPLADVRSPREIFTVTTGEPIAGTESGCPVPERAMRDIGADGALVTVQAAGASRRLPAADFPAKPQRFTFEHADLNTSFAECGPSGATTGWFTFSTHGRAFYALVTVGAQATAQTRQDALRVLDTFTPTPSAHDMEDVTVLAAAAAATPEVPGRVALEADALADAWNSMDTVDEAPSLPDDSGVLVVGVPSGTYRSTDDVLGVEVIDGREVVVLDPDGEFARPCPGRSVSRAAPSTRWRSPPTLPGRSRAPTCGQQTELPWNL